MHAGTLVRDLLHRSEIIFPPVNAISTISNLVMVIAVYLDRKKGRDTAAKLPWLAASFALSLGVTIYTLTVMVPINNALKENAKKLDKDPEDEQARKGFREAQATWQIFNVGKSKLTESHGGRR